MCAEVSWRKAELKWKCKQEKQTDTRLQNAASVSPCFVLFFVARRRNISLNANFLIPGPHICHVGLQLNMKRGFLFRFFLPLHSTNSVMKQVFFFGSQLRTPRRRLTSWVESSELQTRNRGTAGGLPWLHVLLFLSRINK